MMYLMLTMWADLWTEYQEAECYACDRRSTHCSLVRSCEYFNELILNTHWYWSGFQSATEAWNL